MTLEEIKKEISENMSTEDIGKIAEFATEAYELLRRNGL